jgi:transglutaminase-like putative cysteine protease
MMRTMGGGSAVDVPPSRRAAHAPHPGVTSYSAASASASHPGTGTHAATHAASVQHAAPGPRLAAAGRIPGGMTFDEALAAAPVVPDAGALAAAARVTYRIRQTFDYTYDAPVYDLAHRLIVSPPPRHADQIRIGGGVTVSDPAATVAWRRLVDGGHAAEIALADVPERLQFDVTVVVERAAAHGLATLPASTLTGRRLLTPTPLTRPDATMHAVARSLAGNDPLATAARCCRWVHERIAYAESATHVATTALEALTGGRGVCQDHAHVMLALCRAAGVPARYVSGHLLGEGGTHAWVEVIVPDHGRDGSWNGGSWDGGSWDGGSWDGGAGWDGAGGARAVALDPCHDRPTDRRYVTVAVGRDYADVAPTSGVYSGAGLGSLVATKRVDVVGLTGA